LSPALLAGLLAWQGAACHLLLLSQLLRQQLLHWSVLHAPWNACHSPVLYGLLEVFDADQLAHMHACCIADTCCCTKGILWAFHAVGPTRICNCAIGCSICIHEQQWSTQGIVYTLAATQLKNVAGFAACTGSAVQFALSMIFITCKCLS
jgi:hypothetical protein